jgi:hypothetical protein
VRRSSICEMYGTSLSSIADRRHKMRSRCSNAPTPYPQPKRKTSGLTIAKQRKVFPGCLKKFLAKFAIQKVLGMSLILHQSKPRNPTCVCFTGNSTLEQGPASQKLNYSRYPTPSLHVCCISPGPPYLGDHLEMPEVSALLSPKFVSKKLHEKRYVKKNSPTRHS